MSKKKLTVILWDAGYREKRYLYPALECLKHQSNLDELDIIFLEWGTTVNSRLNLIKEYPFIKLIDLNNKGVPDAGLKWNIGMHLATTDWVAYYHCDPIAPDHYSNILDVIASEERKNPSIAYITGCVINDNGKTPEDPCQSIKPEKIVEHTIQKNPELLTCGKLAVTCFNIHKERFTAAVGGWPWGYRTHYWCGPSYGTKQNKDVKISEHLKKTGQWRDERAVSDRKIYCYIMMHPRPDGDVQNHQRQMRHTFNWKYYSEFCEVAEEKMAKSLLRS